MRGWVYAQYLSVEQNGTSVVVQDHRDDLGIPTITYEQTDPVQTGSVQRVQPDPSDELLGPVDQSGGDVVAITPPEEVGPISTTIRSIRCSCAEIWRSAPPFRKAWKYTVFQTTNTATSR